MVTSLLILTLWSYKRRTEKTVAASSMLPTKQWRNSLNLATTASKRKIWTKPSTLICLSLVESCKRRKLGLSENCIKCWKRHTQARSVLNSCMFQMQKCALGLETTSNSDSSTQYKMPNKFTFLTGCSGLTNSLNLFLLSSTQWKGSA